MIIKPISNFVCIFVNIEIMLLLLSIITKANSIENINIINLTLNEDDYGQRADNGFISASESESESVTTTTNTEEEMTNSESTNDSTSVDSINTTQWQTTTEGPDKNGSNSHFEYMIIIIPIMTVTIFFRHIIYDYEVNMFHT